MTHEKSKGLTSWLLCWSWLWAKNCWFEELPALVLSLTGIHISKRILSPSLPLSLLLRHHPSHLSGRLRTALFLLHSTPSGDTATTGVPGASLACRESEDGRGATARSGSSLHSEAPALAQPIL